MLTGLQSGTAAPSPGTVLADLFFWKLWLATRFTSPACAPVCCDANHPLPFAPDTFSLVVLADAFPYIWHKRLAADEIMRLAGPDGVVVMPHLHSALGENFSAGNTLTPGAYRDLFAPQQPRLFSDERLLTELLDRSRRGPDARRHPGRARVRAVVHVDRQPARRSVPPVPRTGRAACDGRVAGQPSVPASSGAAVRRS